MYERTLVILKPDAVARRLSGQIISIFEEVGLKIVEAKMLTPGDALLDKHYTSDPAYLKSLGDKNIVAYSEQGLNMMDYFGTMDPTKVGETIRGWLLEYMKSGPVLAMVLEGNCAVRIVRKLVGHTFPADAVPGTIRARFSMESNDLANAQRRSIHNLVHASGNTDEASSEITLWFGKDAVKLSKGLA
jgi:nucleoside-diphosphate kinase